MHAIASLPARLYSSPVAEMTSLILSPCSTPFSMDLNSRTEHRTGHAEHSVPYPPPINVPFPELRSKGNTAHAIDLVETPLISALPTPVDLGPPKLMTGGRGFDTSRLPVELICEIFERYIEDDSPHPTYEDSTRPLISHSCRSDPTVLGQVCSRWREAAIGLPKLWSTILIYNPKPSQVRLTNIWLQRSGNLPLNLEISFDKEDKNVVNIVSASQILASFITYLESWKKIDFQLPLDLLGPLYAVTRSPQNPLKLESVSFEFSAAIRFDHKTPGAHIDTIWRFFHACPALRQVIWNGDSFPTHAPFQQLTHVHVGFLVSVDDILAFLPRLTHIQDLRIEELRLPSKESPVIISPQIILQHLRILRVDSRHVRTASLFANITCPSLESLEIKHDNHQHSSQDVSELSRLLQRSGCRLQNLDLCDSGISDDDLKQFLSNSSLQSLISLNVWMNNISDQIIMLLTSRSQAGSLEFAPSLEKLDLYPCRSTDGLLSRMVASRWHKALDSTHSTTLGQLRRAVIIPKMGFGPIDGAFFRANVLS